MSIENKPAGFNLGSISKIEIAPFYYFKKSPFAPFLILEHSLTDIDVANIYFEANRNWVPIYFTPETAKYLSSSKLVTPGNIHSHTLNFKHPKIRREVYKALYPFMGIRLVVKLTDANGAEMLLGDYNEGLRLSFTKTIPSGGSSYNGTALTIKGSTTFPSLDVYS